MPRPDPSTLARTALLCASLAAAGCGTEPVPPPSAPAGVTATPVSNTAVEVGWGIAAGEVEQYRVERAPDGGAFVPLVTVPDSVTRFVDGGLDPSTAYRYQVLACNTTGCSDPSAPARTITLATLTTGTDSLPDAVVGEVYGKDLRAEGGRVPHAWSVVEGSLPPGLTLEDGGTLFGRPTTPGVFAFTARVESADGQAATVALTLEVVARLVIATGGLPGGVRGQPYNAGVNAEGGRTPHVWTVEAGSLPAGLALSDNGIISGTPDTEQVATFTLRVRGAGGQTASRQFTIQISAPAGEAAVTVETAVLPTGLQGSLYEPTLVADGGDGTYAWSVVGGALPPGVGLQQSGRITGTPSSTGSFTVTVRVASGGRSDTKTFTFRVVPHRTDRYDVTRMDVVDVPGDISPHVDAAIARWQEAVIGDLSFEQVPRGFFGPRNCGGFGSEVNGTSVDDVLVLVNIAPIDGAGKILGRAGPCGLRDGSLLPVVGILTLDADDLTPLVGSETLTDIIFHEIGHILGIGTLWQSFQLLAGAGTADPTFTGPGAVAEYHALGGTGDVPVESTGGEGTAEGHWRESTFDSEIMTGFSERVGVEMPLSRFTIASLADMGYTVNLGAADPYQLPVIPGVAAPDARAGDLGWDVAGVGPVKVLGNGPGGGR